MDASESQPNDDALEMVDVLASDFITRYRNGDRPTVEEYAERHPDLSDAIRQMFPLAASIERIKINDQLNEDGSATLAGHVLSQLGDFRLVREIGRGGMGIVFEAHQESLDRTVAIKVLPKQCLLDDEALARFQMEATTAAGMHHSNIVPIYGTGESDGSHYLVMQLVDGTSLDTLISNTVEVAFVEAANIGLQVADAISYSHSNGVLHRDIKPANILIEEDGTAQVTDFGLAKNVGTDLTNSYGVSGSLRYMAPERFAGVSDQRGDVYAIGLTLFELLAGRPAFEEHDAEHLIGSITSARLPSLKAIRPSVPTDLATIVTKAIQVDPALRYQSAAELRDDLRHFLADEPIRARRISILGRFVRWARRNPTLAAAMSVAAIALLTATLVSTVAYVMTSAANQRSVNALQTSEQTVDIALQSLNGVVDVVSGTPTSSSVTIGDSFYEDSLPNVDLKPSPVAAKILERLQPIYERLSQQSPTRPDIVLQMVDASIQLARIQHALGRTPDSIATLQSSLALLERDESQYAAQTYPGAPQESPSQHTRKDLASVQLPFDESQLRLARLHNELGDKHSAEFDHAQSIASYAAAIDAASQLEDTDTAGRIELARAHLNSGNPPPYIRRSSTRSVAETASDLGHIDQAIQILQSLETSSSQNATTNILHARSLLARSRLSNRRRLKHIDVIEAVAILRNQLEETPDDTNVRFELVETLADVNIRGMLSQARFNDAYDRLREALQEIEKLRTTNPDNALFLTTEVHLRHKLAAIARAQTRYDDAEKLLREAIELQTTLINTWPDSVPHRCWRAMLFRSQATMYLQWERNAAAETALANANADLNAIDDTTSAHPLVTRTRQAIRELTETLPTNVSPPSP